MTDWAFDRGYENVYLSGHSAGGYYVGEYGECDDRIAGRILLSPLQDHKFVLSHWFPGDGELEAALETAKRLVADGRGHQLIPVSGWFYAISAATLIERAGQPDGLWLNAINASDSPLLLAWGTLESRHELWQELFDQFEVANKTSLAIPGCDHFFIGFEEVLARALGEFIEAN